MSSPVGFCFHLGELNKPAGCYICDVFRKPVFLRRLFFFLLSESLVTSPEVVIVWVSLVDHILCLSTSFFIHKMGGKARCSLRNSAGRTLQGRVSAYVHCCWTWEPFGHEWSPASLQSLLRTGAPEQRALSGWTVNQPSSRGRLPCLSAPVCWQFT